MHGLGRHRLALDDQRRRPRVENPCSNREGWRAVPATDLSFLQISDSHIGFNKDANKDVTATFKIALDRINAMPTPPSFLIHTGDITQLSKPEEFDTFDQVLKSCRTKDVFYVPGEHDVLNDGGKLYRERYLKSVEAKGAGWYSFNKNGVHFIGLVNVLNLQAGGLGNSATSNSSGSRPT